LWQLLAEILCAMPYWALGRLMDLAEDLAGIHRRGAPAHRAADPGGDGWRPRRGGAVSQANEAARPAVP